MGYGGNFENDVNDVSSSGDRCKRMELSEGPPLGQGVATRTFDMLRLGRGPGGKGRTAPCRNGGGALKSLQAPRRNGGGRPLS